jgi:hypothetical protein
VHCRLRLECLSEHTCEHGRQPLGDEREHLTLQPHREDLRELRVCSVDPPGCRDIDDALSCRALDAEGHAGQLELGVHIADVTSFLKPETAMDAEACRRGGELYKLNPVTTHSLKATGFKPLNLLSEISQFQTVPHKPFHTNRSTHTSRSTQAVPHKPFHTNRPTQTVPHKPFHTNRSIFCFFKCNLYRYAAAPRLT